VGASKSGSMAAESRRLGQDEEHANRLKRKRLEKNKRQVEVRVSCANGALPVPTKASPDKTCRFGDEGERKQSLIASEA
jgi:hypothetical protein